MIKIFNAAQVRKIDSYTIEEEVITSLELMERAAMAVFEELLYSLVPQQKIYVFAGPGNNGGDALAIARMLYHLKAFDLAVYLVTSDGKLSPDCKANKESLEKLVEVHAIGKRDDVPAIPAKSVIIDGLFGSGLNRPLEGVYKEVVEAINKANGSVYAIDIPSGMQMEDNRENDPEAIVKAGQVFSFQFPKLSLLLPENKDYCNRFSILDIGLSALSIEKEESPYHYIEQSDIASLLVPRRKFSHKGDYGRAFIVAGSPGKMGAAILAARACLRTGVGLLTMHVPACGIAIMQAVVPEAMVDAENGEAIPNSLDKHTIGIGPGIGTSAEARNLLQSLFNSYKKPMVIDADALNLIAADEELKKTIPAGSILTPHPLEFDRLLGFSSADGYQRLQSARNLAQEHRVYMVLKGAYTAVVTPQGDVYFNSSGNPGMATGGSGDVLTGILTSLLAQGHTPLDACLSGVYLHGLAGDLAAEDKSQPSMLPSDVIDYLGKAFQKLGAD
ncbi:NAD(P)H-hydrate dehydratase [Viscerimonas tarda]